MSTIVIQHNDNLRSQLQTAVDEQSRASISRNGLTLRLSFLPTRAGSTTAFSLFRTGDELGASIRGRLHVDDDKLQFEVNLYENIGTEAGNDLVHTFCE